VIAALVADSGVAYPPRLLSQHLFVEAPAARQERERDVRRYQRVTQHEVPLSVAADRLGAAWPRNGGR
jgi:hypothetical protein